MKIRTWIRPISGIQNVICCFGIAVLNFVSSACTSVYLNGVFQELQKEKSENERRMADAEDTHTRALTAARAESEKHGGCFA